MRHGRYKAIREEKRNIQKRRVAKEIYGKETIWIVKQIV